MYWDGEGQKRDPIAAARLVEQVYDWCGEKEDDPDFVKAALWMGRLYQEGIGVRRDPKKAWICFKQAEFSRGLTGKEESAVRKALAEAEAELPKKDDSPYSDSPLALKSALSGGYGLGLRAVREEDRLRIQAERLTKPEAYERDAYWTSETRLAIRGRLGRVPSSPPVFVAIPEKRIAAEEHMVVQYACGVEAFHVFPPFRRRYKEDGCFTANRIDRIIHRDGKQEFDFLLYDEPVAVLKAERYLFIPSKTE